MLVLDIRLPRWKLTIRSVFTNETIFIFVDPNWSLNVRKIYNLKWYSTPIRTQEHYSANAIIRYLFF